MNPEELLKKLKALSERGIGGEKENAEVLMQKLMEKYDITLKDIEEDRKETVWFRYKNEYDLRLIGQLKYMLQIKSDSYKHRYKKKIIGFDLSLSEKIEFEYLYEILKTAFKKELEIFFKAFVQQNYLFPSKKIQEKEKDEKINEEELLKMQAMMHGITKVQINKALENKTKTI